MKGQTKALAFGSFNRYETDYLRNQVPIRDTLIKITKKQPMTDSSKVSGQLLTDSRHEYLAKFFLFISLTYPELT